MCSSYFAGKNRPTSTKEESLSKAKEIAEDWYLQLRGKLRAADNGRDLLDVENPDYADLDGDGQEEAIYEGFTCMSDTGGMDFFGAVKLMQDGKLVDMPIKPHEGRFKGRDVYDRLRGHMSLAVKNGKLVEVYPVYSAQKNVSLLPGWAASVHFPVGRQSVCA